MDTRSDRDLLIETHTLMKEVHRQVFGNGQPGLVTRVASLEERTPSNTRARVTGVGGIAGVIAFLVMLVPEIIARLS